MERDKILERLKSLLQDKYDIDPATLTVDSRQDDIGLDSISMVDLMMDIESDLDFQFPDLNLPKNPSLGQIVDIIVQNLSS
jgi:acyl carrier protein